MEVTVSRGNRAPARRGTQTSAFGAPGRVSHDSSPFYASRLYQQQANGQPTPTTEDPLPGEVLDRVLHSSACRMDALPDNSVHLMVTSPPYNVGKEYDEDLTLAEYLAFLGDVWAEVHRVLVPGGRACVNVANLGRRPYLPVHAPIAQQMIDLGFLMRGEIIWQKGASSGASTAWGSWMSPSNPTLRDTHEYILVFSKGSFRRPQPPDRKSTISRDEFLTFTKSVWEFPAASARRIGHAAPFPVELPYRLIQLYTYSGEVVLDPFMGSGQTAIAALKARRRYVGYETDETYVKLAERRIRQFAEETLAPTLFDAPA